MGKKLQQSVGGYEIGKVLGEGTFAKVREAMHLETGAKYAIKVLDKKQLIEHDMVDSLSREITIMKGLKHPCLVCLYDVLSTEEKIYLVCELVAGGELFDRVDEHGRMSEAEGRYHFQRLIDAVDYCHQNGVFHRDIKPENILLNDKGECLISDFGLSALPEQLKKDGLLHTTCGTPNYVAPEVLGDMGYDGGAADIWSCGVVLYVLLSGVLPFDEPQLHQLFRKIADADFLMPPFLSEECQHLLAGLLEPDPTVRLSAAQIRQHPWFQVDYAMAQPLSQAVAPGKEETPWKEVEEETLPVSETGERGNLKGLNAFDLINMSNALSLSSMFGDAGEDQSSRFTSDSPPEELMRRLTKFARSEAQCQVAVFDFKLKMTTTKGPHPMTVVAEVMRMTSRVHMVELRLAKGLVADFKPFFKDLRSKLSDIVLK